MTEKHYPYCGGSFDRIIFDKDGSVWVPEAENAKLRELVRKMYSFMDMVDYVYEFDDPMHLMFVDDMRELGIEVDA